VRARGVGSQGFDIEPVLDAVENGRLDLDKIITFRIAANSFVAGAAAANPRVLARL
jgi:threonine dehydrogenase-like Zn-dependent dehydrogenase